MRASFSMMLVPLMLALAACQPNEPPPDLVKTQREAMNKAKAVEGQLQQAAQQNMKQADDEK